MSNQQYQNLQSFSFNRNYVNCPTCGRSIEMSELMQDAAARQEAINKLPEDVQRYHNNSLQPVPSCKICKSQMQQGLQGYLQRGS